MKNDFFQQKNTSECTTFTVRPTGQHWAVCNNITHTNSAGGLCSVTNRGHCDLYSHNPLHSQGECGDHKEPHSKGGSSHIITRQTGSLAREVVPGPTRVDAEYCAVNFVIVPGVLNSNSARGTEHCKCQGHITLIVPGALNICGAMGMINNCGICDTHEIQGKSRELLGLGI